MMLKSKVEGPILTFGSELSERTKSWLWLHTKHPTNAFFSFQIRMSKLVRLSRNSRDSLKHSFQSQHSLRNHKTRALISVEALSLSKQFLLHFLQPPTPAEAEAKWYWRELVLLWTTIFAQQTTANCSTTFALLSPSRWIQLEKRLSPQLHNGKIFESKKNILCQMRAAGPKNVSIGTIFINIIFWFCFSVHGGLVSCVNRISRDGSMILVRGPQWSFDPRGALSLKLPQNCLILKKSWGKWGRPPGSAGGTNLLCTAMQLLSQFTTNLPFVKDRRPMDSGPMIHPDAKKVHKQEQMSCAMVSKREMVTQMWCTNHWNKCSFMPLNKKGFLFPFSNKKGKSEKEGTSTAMCIIISRQQLAFRNQNDNKTQKWTKTELTFMALIHRDCVSSVAIVDGRWRVKRRDTALDMFAAIFSFINSGWTQRTSAMPCFCPYFFSVKCSASEGSREVNPTRQKTN